MHVKLIQVIEQINWKDKIYKWPVRHNKTEIIQNFDVPIYTQWRPATENLMGFVRPGETNSLS